MKNEKIWQADYQQIIFRQLVNAFSYPGTVEKLADNSGCAALSVVATLVDNASSLSDPHQLIAADELIRLQIQLSSTETAAYILCAGNKVVDFKPSLGTLANPDKGATLIIKVDSLVGGSNKLTLSGPGIKETSELSPQGLDSSWISQRNQWNNAFPLGIDLIVVSEDSLVAIPRTTIIKELA